MKQREASEALFVRYLLGDLPEDEKVKIEDHAFQDRKYLQDLLAVESDLIDEYVRGELSDSERSQFEGRFLASPQGRRKVEFARALNRVAPEFAVTKRESRPAARLEPIGWRSALAALVRGLGPAAGFSVAAAAMLIILGVAWLTVESVRMRAELAALRAEQRARQEEQKALEEEFAAERARNQELAARLGEQELRGRGEEPATETESKPESSGTQPPGPATVALALLPGVSRGGGPRQQLIVPQTARRVSLQVGIEPEDDYSSFRVEIRTQTGQQVWTGDNLHARSLRSGRAVVVNLPASRLGAGKFELTLKGITADGKSEDVGYYYFDAMKK